MWKSDVRNELLCIESGMSSCTNTSLKFWETLISLPIGRIQGNVISWWWRQEPKCWWVVRKYWNNLDADILVAKDTGERSALAWHHHLWYLMLGASCSLEDSETVLAGQRNPEEMEEVMTSGSSKDVSNSGILMESVRMEPNPSSKSTTAWSRSK